MTSPREHLIDWLRDAHAMEEEAKSLLKTQIERLENYPEATSKLRQHLEETEQQRMQVEQCLRRLGEEPSTVKDMGTKFMANLQGLGHMMTSDEVLKNALASHAFERFEAVCYHSLATAAETANEPEIANVARRILRQEEEMGEWVWNSIPKLTQTFLERDAAGMQASR